jgi:hypothetical protein
MEEPKLSYYARHRDRILARQTLYNQQNKERQREYHKEYFQTNKVSLTARHKQWHQAHPKPTQQRTPRTRAPRSLPPPPTPTEVIATFVAAPEPEPSVTYTTEPIIVRFD